MKTAYVVVHKKKGSYALHTTDKTTQGEMYCA